MKSLSEISDVRLLGFYQLKELLGIGDDRLRMILAVGEVKPILFTNPRTSRIDKMYSLFSVKEALQRLQGIDVQLEYEKIYSSPNAEVEQKYKSVQLRLIRKRNAANG
jgi:hypothetical protein